MRHLALLTLFLTSALAPLAAAGERQPHTYHIRPLSAPLSHLLNEGLRRSMIVRALVERVEASDLIVYIEHLTGPPFRLAGRLTLVGTAGMARYVRIGLRYEVADDLAIAMLAHELEHAAELAEAPWVVDQVGLFAYYRPLGRAQTVEGHWWFDTDRARATTARTLKELRSGAPGTQPRATE